MLIFHNSSEISIVLSLVNLFIIFIALPSNLKEKSLEQLKKKSYRFCVKKMFVKKLTNKEKKEVIITSNNILPKGLLSATKSCITIYTHINDFIVSTSKQKQIASFRF